MTPAVGAADLTKEDGRVRAVSAVSLSLRAGTKTAIVGPNGSGKTMLLHMLSGRLRPTSGTATIHGVPVQDREAKPLVGIAPDDLPMPVTLTGFEMLNLTRRLRNREPVIDVDEVLHVLGVLHAMHRPVGQYSHGMKRKLQLVCAVMHGPQVLFLDEPYRGLDPMSEILLRRLIDTIVEAGATVLTCTHSLDITRDDYDHLAVMHAGELVASGGVDQLLEDHHASSVTDLFLTVTGNAASLKEAENDLAHAFRRAYDTSGPGALAPVGPATGGER